MRSLSAQDYLQALYRFCLVQTGSAVEAESAVHTIVAAAVRATDYKQSAPDYVALFKAALGWAEKTPIDRAPAGWIEKLHALPLRERQALTLFYLEIFDLETIGAIFGLSLEELATTVGAARDLLRNH